MLSLFSQFVCWTIPFVWQKTCFKLHEKKKTLICLAEVKGQSLRKVHQAILDPENFGRLLHPFLFSKVYLSFFFSKSLLGHSNAMYFILQSTIVPHPPSNTKIVHPF